MKFSHKSESIQKMHRLCTNNRELIGSHTRCGCFYCRRIYPGREIKIWIDEGKTALCPHCGIDSVIVDSEWGEINDETLKEMYEFWFTITESDTN